jgi:nucleoside-diphosphate-sugar epimerase
MLYDMDVLWALVDVEDVAEAIYKAATIPDLHGKNYLLSSESYRISDIIFMLNDQTPVGDPLEVYSSDLAKKDLGIVFKPASIPLHNYSA